MPVQPDPYAEETAVLPIIEGSPLVRPYVPAPSFDHEPPPKWRPEPMPVQDAFGTAVMPPVGAPPGPSSPIPGQPLPPQDVTAVVPPVPSFPPAAPSNPEAPDEQQADLGIFAFRGEPEQMPGGRAERRSRQQAEASRRRTLVIGAGVAVAALGAGLALVSTPSDSGKRGTDKALPIPSGSLWEPSPTDPSPSAAVPSVTASSAPASPTATPTAKASAVATTKAPTPVVAPTAVATPTADSSPRTLRLGDTGSDVKAMQQMLVAASCGGLDQSLVTGRFDGSTQSALADFQHEHHIKGENGVYGPRTQSVLPGEAQNSSC